MPEDTRKKSRRLTKDEKIGAARGINGLVKDSLGYAQEFLTVAVMRLDPDQAPARRAIMAAQEQIDCGIRYLAHLEDEIGPFVTSTKEVDSRE